MRAGCKRRGRTFYAMTVCNVLGRAQAKAADKGPTLAA
jgi:hypothetical protein